MNALPDKPLISVLIPSYNHAEYITETIESIWQQPYQKIEIVVVDDCSTDRSFDILRALQKRSPVVMQLHLNERNLGPKATVNRALQLSHGDLIIPFASDDKFAPNRVERQVREFHENPELRIIYGNGYIIRNGDKTRKLHGPEIAELLSREPEEILHFLYTHASPLFLQCALMRRDFLLAVGAYDGDLLADDWLLNVRMFESMKSKKEFRYIDDESVYYRQHDANLHKNFERQSRLKLEFVGQHTPDPLKAEAYANIHYDVARAALSNGLWGEAIRHFRASQSSQFNIKRLGFLTKFARKWLKRRSQQRNGSTS